MAAALIAPLVLVGALFVRQSLHEIALAGAEPQRARLWISLAVVALYVAASVAVALAIARDLAVHARGIKAAAMSLHAGDLTVDIPYIGEPGELGFIAGGMEAFRQATTDNALLISELETAQSWLRLALETGRMAAWRVTLPDGPIEPSPELAQVLGYPPDTKFQSDDFAAVIVDPDVVRRFHEERRRAASGELDHQALDEIVVAVRRQDTGEVGWALLRREVVIDPVRQRREIVGVAIDITERKRMMDELNHRVKNNLATVVSLAMQTAKSTGDLHGFLKAFTGRVQALSRISELLARRSWGQVELKDVIAATLRPNLDGVELAAGSPEHTAVSARAAISLCQILHELAINAAQHGALAAGGRVQIAWSTPDLRRGALTWTERSRAPTTPPTRVGFGIALIQRLADGDLGGSADLDFRPEGLTATINFDLQGATA